MRYTINNETLSSFEEDINVFKKEIENLDVVGYVYPHFFNQHNEITSYGAVVIEIDKTDLDEKQKYLQEIYNINPNKIYSSENKTHLVFMLEKGISKLDYKRISKSLEFILDGNSKDYYFCPEYKVVTEYEENSIDKGLTKFLTQFYFALNNSEKLERTLSKNNYDKYLTTKEILIIDILEKLRLPLVDIDPIKNIHLKYGYPFEFVNSYLGGIKKTFKFFNEYFDIGFESDEKKNQDKYTKDGVLLEEVGDLIKGQVGYISISDKGNKTITDFFVKIYFKIKKVDGSFVYIVSLVNEIEGVETDKIFWFNGTSKTAFSDYIQKYGNFHFYGNENHIKDLHREIANTKNIPTIKNIVGFGFHEEEGIIVFKNGIWDIKNKVFTEKKEEEKYYFNYDYSGYFITDKQGNDLSNIINDQIPSLNIDKTINIDDIINFLNSLYSDDTGLFLLSIIFGMFGYLLFGDQKEPFPFLFAKGISGSGKTTFNELIQKSWGINKGGTDFGNSTVFTMTLMLSHLIKFPYFLGEYRTNIEQARIKEGILRSVFDRKTQTKGRADQTMISYDYVAIPVMDGEEMIDDGAIRTRTIQRHFVTKHKIKGDFEKLTKEGGHILNNLLYTYLLKANKDNYLKGLEEGSEYFGNIASEYSPRIAKNLTKIYAGCYAFDTKLEDKFIKVLSDSCEDQIKDIKENSTSMQIIKAISKFLDSNTFNATSLVGDKVVINWNTLDEYIKKYRVQLSLKYETYKEHIEALGYEIGYLDTGTKLIYGVIVKNDNIPNEFLVNPDFYLAKKQYDNSNLG